MRIVLSYNDLMQKNFIRKITCKKKKTTNLSSQSYTINYKGTYFLLKYKKKNSQAVVDHTEKYKKCIW